MKNQTLRIIGGKWRSRKIHFPEILGLRPTPDRVRETLFNWLAPFIQDTACLDLFAGSGALGFEALSRGARSVVMVDQAIGVITSLQANSAKLAVENPSILRAAIPNEFHKISPQKFDIIFLDPPFQKNLIEPCCSWLEQHGYLAEHAVIYLEMEKDIKNLLLPSNWEIIKDKTAGAVRYCLALRQERVDSNGPS